MHCTLYHVGITGNHILSMNGVHEFMECEALLTVMGSVHVYLRKRTVSRRLPEHTAIASTDSKSQIQEEFGLLELASWSHAFCLREAMLYLRELYVTYTIIAT